MKKLVFVCFIAFFFICPSALAADKNLNPWYAKIAGSYAIQAQDYDEENASLTEWAFDNGFGGLVSVGYEWGTWGIELEGSYRSLDADYRTTKATGVEDTLSGDQSQISGMVNLYVILMPEKTISTYFGLGAGMTRIEWDTVRASTGAYYDDSDSVFTWQAIAGVSFDLNEWIALEVDYRYICPGDPDLTDSTGTEGSFDGQHLHNITAGLKFRF